MEDIGRYVWIEDEEYSWLPGKDNKNNKILTMYT